MNRWILQLQSKLDVGCQLLTYDLSYLYPNLEERSNLFYIIVVMLHGWASKPVDRPHGVIISGHWSVPTKLKAWADYFDIYIIAKDGIYAVVHVANSWYKLNLTLKFTNWLPTLIKEI